MLVLALAGCGALGTKPTQAPGAVLSQPTAAIPAALASPTAGVSRPAGAQTGAVQPTAAPLATAPVAGQLQPTGNLENDVRAVANKVRPAVVFVGIIASLQQFSQPVPVGNGSGAIIDRQGHILTNNHVVAQAQALKVTLPDGRSFDAQIIGTDRATDLAVIQIQGDNLPTIPLGDSDRLQVGDWVVAVGNALGLEGGPTVTAGVVSALNRTIDEGNGAALYGLIQTDAAINPGNSGGPLVNLQGELVGINTAVPGPTGQGFQPFGIGFAISVKEARSIAQQLISQGHVTRPYLGIVPLTVTPAIRVQARLSVNSGVAVTSVAMNSPAAQAGLRPGDVIVAADGKPITNDGQLRQAIDAHQVGDTIELTIVRGGQQRTIRAQLAQAPTAG
jgi:S1-C subfamily serine protease